MEGKNASQIKCEGLVRMIFKQQRRWERKKKPKSSQRDTTHTQQKKNNTHAHTHTHRKHKSFISKEFNFFRRFFFYSKTSFSMLCSGYTFPRRGFQSKWQLERNKKKLMRRSGRRTWRNGDRTAAYINMTLWNRIFSLCFFRAYLCVVHDAIQKGGR